MSSNIKMTLIDQHNYLELKNDDLFKNFKRPEGLTDEDYQTLKENILLTAGEFETLYADPYFTQFAVGTWSRKHYYTFSKWIRALSIEYEPLENFRRVEQFSDVHTGQENTEAEGSETISNSESTSENSTVTNTNVVAEETAGNSVQTTTDSSDSTTENKVSAFNSSSYSPESEVTGTSSTSTRGETDTESTRDVTTTDNGSNALTGSKTLTGERGNTNTGSKRESSESTHEGLVFGNIGTLTSQAMLQAELDVVRFNLIQNISDMFVDEFCIKVY